MEEIVRIASIACMVLNSACVGLIFFFIVRWIKRIENRVHRIEPKIDEVLYKQTSMFVNELVFLKKNLIELERYEEAKKLDELIKKEMDRIK